MFWNMGSFVVILLGIAMIGFGIWTIVQGKNCIEENKRIDEYNRSQTQIYEEKRAENIKRNITLEAVYHREHNDWETMAKEIKAKISSPLQQSKSVRDKLYSQDMIYPKYQNLPALTSIYEYFITGRCDELTGPHGAYNLYEDEMRRDMVISQLNLVIANLEQIKQNQYMLYQQVKEIQDTASLIGYELKQIKGYTVALTELSAMNLYYNAVSARNAHIMTTYHLLS